MSSRGDQSLKPVPQDSPPANFVDFLEKDLNRVKDPMEDNDHYLKIGPGILKTSKNERKMEIRKFCELG